MNIEERTKEFKSVPLSKMTLAKMREYARQAGSSECYGFLIAPKKDNSGVVFDAYLAPNQKVSAGHVTLPAEQGLVAKKELDALNMKAIGFWHSHGSFGTFHSGTDDHNMDGIGRQLALNNSDYHEAANYFTTQDDALVVVSGDAMSKLEVTLGLEEVEKNVTALSRVKTQDLFEREEFCKCGVKPSVIFAFYPDKGMVAYTPDGMAIQHDLAIGSMKIEKAPSRTLVTGAAYSVVVNNRGELYAEIQHFKFSGALGGVPNMEKTANCNVHLLRIDPDIEFTPEGIKHELSKKLIGWTPGYRNGSDGAERKGLLAKFGL